MFEPRTEALCSLADWCSIWHEELSPRLLGGQSRLVFPKVRLFYLSYGWCWWSHVTYLLFRNVVFSSTKKCFKQLHRFYENRYSFYGNASNFAFIFGKLTFKLQIEKCSCPLFVQILLCVWTLLFIFNFFYGILGKQGASLRWSKVLIKTRGHRRRRID